MADHRCTAAGPCPLCVVHRRAATICDVTERLSLLCAERFLSAAALLCRVAEGLPGPARAEAWRAVAADLERASTGVGGGEAADGALAAECMAEGQVERAARVLRASAWRAA